MCLIHTCIGPEEDDGRSPSCTCSRENRPIHSDQAALLVAVGALRWKRSIRNGKVIELRNEAVIAVPVLYSRPHDRPVSARMIGEFEITAAYIEGSTYHQDRIKFFNQED